MANFNDPKGDYNPYAPPSAVADTASADEDAVLIPAERGTRWWARFVDKLLLTVTAAPALIVWFSTRQSLAMGLGLLSLVFMGYQWYLISTTGQTLAKKWMGIKIVKMDGSPVDFVSGVVLREMLLAGASFIPYIGGLIGLIDALMIFGGPRRCLHDQIAGTQVVLALNIT